MNEYIIRKNPKDNLWYVLGLIRCAKRYYIPISHGYKIRQDAADHAKRQRLIDRMTKVLGSKV